MKRFQNFQPVVLDYCIVEGNLSGEILKGFLADLMTTQDGGFCKKRLDNIS